MSTKTTFKRVALVTVAAMGFGLLSVAPSSAIVQTDTLAVSATAGATSVDLGTAATTTLTQTFLGTNSDTMTVTVSLFSSPAGNTVVPTITAQLYNSVNGLAAATGLVGTMMDTTTVGTYATATAKWTLTLPSTAGAGTYVIKATPTMGVPFGTLAAANPTNQVPSAGVVTWTVTVAGGTVADATTTSITNSYGVATGSADKAVRIAAGSSTAGAATVVVTPLADAATTTGSTVVSVSVSGPGTVAINQTSSSGTSSGYKTQNAGYAPGAFYVHLFADGQVGTSTITITIGTVVKTELVYFYGAAASVTTTTTTPTINSGSGAVATAILTATVKDANGNVVPGANCLCSFRYYNCIC